LEKICITHGGVGAFIALSKIWNMQGERKLHGQTYGRLGYATAQQTIRCEAWFPSYGFLTMKNVKK